MLILQWEHKRTWWMPWGHTVWPPVSHGGDAFSKSSLTIMMISGSSAAGNPIPPQLWFMSKSPSSDSQFHYDIAENIPMVHMSFGFLSEWLPLFPWVKMKKEGWIVWSLKNMSRAWKVSKSMIWLLKIWMCYWVGMKLLLHCWRKRHQRWHNGKRLPTTIAAEVPQDTHAACPWYWCHHTAVASYWPYPCPFTLWIWGEKGPD